MPSSDVIIHFNTKQYFLCVSFKTACYIITAISLAYHLGFSSFFVWVLAANRKGGCVANVNFSSIKLTTLHNVF